MVIPHPQTAPATFSIEQFTSTSVSFAATTVEPTTSALPQAAASTTTSPSTTTEPPTTTTLLAPTGRVLMSGDSMAFDEWPAIAAAMYASGITIGSYVSPGAGLLDTKYDSSTAIGKAVTDLQPDLVLYQGSLWDYGTVAEQRAAYERFANFVTATGARLGLITIPPLRDDQSSGQLATLTGVMHEVADAHPGQVFVLDSDRAWGPEFVLDVNGDKIPERKPDGVHVCASGAAMYAVWLTGELQQRFAGFVPSPPTVWATGNWVDDPRYTQPAGICAKLP